MTTAPPGQSPQAGGLAVRGVGVFTANWAALALQVVTGLIVARGLGAAGRGTVAMLWTGVALTASLGSLGTPAAGAHHLRRGSHPAWALVGAFLLLVVTITALAGVSTALFVNSFIRIFLAGNALSAGTLAATLIALPALMLATFVGTLLLARGEVHRYARAAIGGASVTLVLTAGFVGWTDLGITGAMSALAAGQVVAALLGAWLLAPTPEARGFETRSGALPDLLRFGLRHFPATAASHLFKRADLFLVGYFLTPGDVGRYAIASQCYDAILSIPRAIGPLLLGESAATSPREGGAAAAQTARTLGVLMLGCVLFTGLAAVPLVPVLYGQDFRASVPPLLLLLVASVAVGHSISMQAFLSGTGRPGLTSTIATVCGVVNLILSVAWIPLWQLVGNAAATLVASVLLAVLNTFAFAAVSGLPTASAVVPSRGDLAAWWRWTMTRVWVTDGR